MAKFVLATQAEFDQIVDSLPQSVRSRVAPKETALSQWGFQAIRFVSRGEEWIVIPYMEIATVQEALAETGKMWASGEERSL